MADLEPARIFRYEVPVDDQWHSIPLSGQILHVASRDPRAVEFWAIHTGSPLFTCEFRAFGTGQPLPHHCCRHVGSAITAEGQLVWHLFERNPLSARPPEVNHG